jgi:ADP-ribose pyrophosphatase YjhB (NUDIX family)
MARRKPASFGTRVEKAAAAAGGRAVEHWLSRALPLAAAPAAFIALAVAIVFMHRAWGGSTTRTPLYAVLVALSGVGVAAYTWHAAGGRKQLRAMATATMGIAALVATVGLVIGLTRMAGLYVLGAAVGSVLWGVRHVMKWADEGGHPLGKLGEHIDTERHHIFNLRRTGKGTVTADVAARPGATIEEFQGHLPVLGAAAQAPPGGATLRPDLERSDLAHLEILVADLLKEGVPWPGPHRLGGLVTDPIPLGLHANGEEVLGRVLTADGDVEHLLIVGVTGAGKSQFARILVGGGLLLRRRVNVVGIDCSKGLQTFGPIAHGLTGNGILITSQRQARAFLKVMPQVIKARTDYLASEGMDKWAPFTPAGKPTKINLLVVWVEEAADLADSESYFQMLRTARSGGVEIYTSLQRASWDEMATKARAMHGGGMAFGCYSAEDVAFALPDEVVDAGAMPLWRNHKPGYAYLAGLNVPPENWPRMLRGFAADRAELAAAVTAASAIRDPMDPITAAALGPLWAKRTVYPDPVGVDAKAAAAALTRLAGATRLPRPALPGALTPPPAFGAPTAASTGTPPAPAASTVRLFAQAVLRGDIHVDEETRAMLAAAEARERRREEAGRHEVTGRVVVPGPWPAHDSPPPTHHDDDDHDEDEDLEEAELSDKDRAEIDAAQEEILGPLEAARTTEIRAAGGGPDEVDGPDDLDAPVPDTGDVEMDLDEDDAPQGDPRALFERQLAAWLDEGRQEFTVKELYRDDDSLLKRMGRERRWFYRNLPAYVEAGILAEGDEIGTYVIARDPRGEPAALERAWRGDSRPAPRHPLPGLPPGQETPIMTHTPTAGGLAAFLPAASASAAEAEKLAEILADPHGGLRQYHPNDVLGRGLAAVTHALLAVAAAVQASGNDTSDALTDAVNRIDDLGTCLECRLGDLDDTLGAIAAEIAGVPRRRWRLRWPRRRRPAAGADTAAHGSGVCDNTSAGVIIGDGAGRYLVFDRATFPPGTAPVAGHVDEHGGFEEAAFAEAAEEVGLTVTGLRQVTGGWRDNACRRAPGRLGTGHEWSVYQATVSGELRPSLRETRNARLLTAGQLQDLAARTASYAHGLLTDAEFAASPGIEPVWAQWLTDAGIIHVPPADLAAIDRLAAGKTAGAR